MKLNRQAVISICADAWGISPSEFREKMKRREVTVADVLTRLRLELQRNPLTAQTFMEWLVPGMKARDRKNKHQEAMIESFKRAKRKKP